jgi:hypothetical protein
VLVIKDNFTFSSVNFASNSSTFYLYYNKYIYIYIYLLRAFLDFRMSLLPLSPELTSVNHVKWFVYSMQAMYVAVLIFRWFTGSCVQQKHNVYRTHVLSFLSIPTAAARVRSRVWSSGICGGRSGAGAGFLRVLRFPMPILILHTIPQSSSTYHPGLVQ